MAENAKATAANGKSATETYTNEAYEEDVKTGEVDVAELTNIDVMAENTIEPPEEKMSAYDGSEAADIDTLADVSCFIGAVIAVETAAAGVWQSHRQWLKQVFTGLFAVAFVGYFCYAMYYHFGDEGSVRLLWMTAVVVVVVLQSTLRRHFGDRIAQMCLPFSSRFSEHRSKISWGVVCFVVAAVVVVAFLDVFTLTDRSSNLISGVGLVVFVVVCFLFSSHPDQVGWREVFWGIGIQLVFGMAILRSSWGSVAIGWTGDRVSDFLRHADAGSMFVFGKKYTDHFFAFKVLPVGVFISTIISVLYYVGVMQVIIRKVAWLLYVTLGTTAAESLNATANFFFSMDQAVLLIRPLVPVLTRSELHAVLTAGFATVSSATLAGYIMFGVPAQHLIAASVMSVPAALTVSKLLMPETEKSRTTTEDVECMPRSHLRNVIEAAAHGAAQSIKMLTSIAATLIAFIAMMSFINSVLTWLGERVGIEGVTFEWICSYALWPVAFLMGADIADCPKVAELLGVKTFVNEYLAYSQLGGLIANRVRWQDHIANNGSYYYIGQDIALNGTDSILTNGILSERSEVITTYALCGFSNIASIGMILAVLGPLAPARKGDTAQLALSAMIAGNIACFMTACIAGMLYCS